jgi:hypothetical protein
MNASELEPMSSRREASVSTDAFDVFTKILTKVPKEHLREVLDAP